MPRRNILFGLTALALATTVQATTPVQPFHPASRDEAAVRIEPIGAPGAAEGLEVSARCHETKPRTAVVTLSWDTPAAAAGRSQRVDISKLHEGFDTGTFETTASLAADVDGVAVEGPEPGLYYYWRVLNHAGNGWVTSKVERFEVPICPWDGPADAVLDGSLQPGGAR